MTGAKKKATGKTAAKRPAAKASGAKKAKKSTAPGGSGGRNPLYILIIMCLLAVILVMLNRFYSEHDTGRKPRNSSVTDLFRAPMKEARTPDDQNIKVPEKEARAVDEKPDIAVKVYFLRLNEKSEKFYLTPVTRRVTAGSPLEPTMQELINGPTARERDGGLLSAVPAGLRIRSITVRNRVAEIDFDESLGKGAAGSVLISRIDQLVYTATQFGRVDSVVITINGRRRKSLGSDGISIGGPLHRR